jgi:hypothetical protein
MGLPLALGSFLLLFLLQCVLIRFEINRFLGVWFPAHDTLLLPAPGNKKAETRGWISAKIKFSKAIDWVFIAFTKPTAEPSEWGNKGAAQFATSLD